MNYPLPFLSYDRPLHLLVVDDEEFDRATNTSHIEGTGLGIHLAKRFMEYHSGQLTFESELGKGTTVRLFFPHAAALIDS